MEYEVMTCMGRRVDEAWFGQWVQDCQHMPNPDLLPKPDLPSIRIPLFPLPLEKCSRWLTVQLEKQVQ